MNNRPAISQYIGLNTFGSNELAMQITNPTISQIEPAPKNKQDIATGANFAIVPFSFLAIRKDITT